MENTLLKQVLREYDEKRTKAILDADKRKYELMKVNPKLIELDNEIFKNSIQTSKAILTSNKKERETLLSDLKKKNNSLKMFTVSLTS